LNNPNAETRFVNLYNAARLGAWRIYEREKAAAYWKEQIEWFETALRRLEQTRQENASFKFPEIRALQSAIQTVGEIVQACRGSYELFA
jgi:hypothetical protein